MTLLPLFFFLFCFQQNFALPLIFLLAPLPGRYAEAECRYSLAKPNVIPAIKVRF
jgi:hypothetical protein